MSSLKKRVVGLSRKGRLRDAAKMELEKTLQEEMKLRLDGKTVPRAIKTAQNAAVAALEKADAMDGLVPCFKCGTDVSLQEGDGEVVALRHRFTIADQQIHTFGHLDLGKEFVLCAGCSTSLTEYMDSNSEEVDIYNG